jgi:hypothetical protein
MNLERPWLAEYPAGVPAEIDVDEYPSIVSVLENAITTYHDRPAFSNLGRTLTYAEIDKLSAQFAAYLLGELKLKMPQGQSSHPLVKEFAAADAKADDKAADRVPMNACKAFGGANAAAFRQKM